MIYRDRTAVSDAARFLAATAMTLNPVAICNPINLSDIDKDWKTSALAGYFANPVFRYNRDELHRAALQGNNVQHYWYQIQHNCTPQSTIDKAILEIIEYRVCETLLAAETAAGIYFEEDARTQTTLLGTYGKPDNSFIMRCYDALEHPTTYSKPIKSRFSKEQLVALEERRFRPSEIRKTFTNVLDYYGFRPAWECILDPLVKTIDARDKTESGKSQLVVPQKRVLDGYKMAVLIGHEIESHIRGSENSRALFRDLLRDSPLAPLVNLLAKSNDELFYEGVAKASDVAIGGANAEPHPYFTIAINLALNEHKSFGEVAHIIYILGYTGSTSAQKAVDFAWNVTRRIFRGATDTSKGFAFTKDYGYLAGYEVIGDVPAHLHNYSTLTLNELKLLEDAGVDLMSPKYPRKDAIVDVLGV